MAACILIAEIEEGRQAYAMCYFITLIAQTDDAGAVNEVMTRHGRSAVPVDNPSIRKVLREGERQYLATGRGCDCSSVLALPHSNSTLFEENVAKEEARLKRKGWSNSKVARALEDHRRAKSKHDHRHADSLNLWNAALHALKDELRVQSVGLFIGSYSGAVATEVFSVTRREIPKTVFWLDALASFQPNEVTIFR